MDKEELVKYKHSLGMCSLWCPHCIEGEEPMRCPSCGGDYSTTFDTCRCCGQSGVVQHGEDVDYGSVS
jgi:hypothetical protein